MVLNFISASYRLFDCNLTHPTFDPETVSPTAIIIFNAKTDVIWLGTSRRVQQCASDPLQLHGASIKPSNCVRDLGVVGDSGLTLVDHVTHITSVFLPHSPTLAHPTLLDSRHCSQLSSGARQQPVGLL